MYLQVLLVYRHVACLDAQNPSTTVTQHVVVFRVPRHAVGIWLLRYIHINGADFTLSSSRSS